MALVHRDQRNYKFTVGSSCASLSRTFTIVKRASLSTALVNLYGFFLQCLREKPWFSHLLFKWRLVYCLVLHSIGLVGIRYHCEGCLSCISLLFHCSKNCCRKHSRQCQWVGSIFPLWRCFCLTVWFYFLAIHVYINGLYRSLLSLCECGL